MLRTDKIAKAGLCVLLAGVLFFTPVFEGSADSESNLFTEVLDKDVSVNYRTDTVRRGRFAITASVMAGFEIKSGSAILNFDSVGTVTFNHYVVSSGDYIEPGDDVCEITVTVDKSKIIELENMIELEEAKLAEYSETNEKLLASYDRQISSGTGDVNQAKLLRKRLSVDFDKEKAQRQEYIDSLRVEYERYLTAEQTTSIKAYAPGVVGYLNRYWRGQELAPWEYLGAVYNEGDVRFCTDLASEYLRYNLPITLVQMNGQKRLEFPGKVVTSLSTSLPASLVGDQNYFEVEGDIMEMNPNREFTLKYERASQENVLLVRNAAIYQDSRGQYVLMNVNGKKTRKYVVVGGSNNDDTWIISGVNEGDTVLII